jgi:uncharacterized protein YjbI with pentapeptide repeats
MKLSNDRRAHEGARPTWQPIPAWRWMLAAAAAVVITAFVVTIWLLAIASDAKPGTDQANARLDAVRTGLAAGAGAGAAVGLMLAFRRQHHQEIATDLTDRDATERRITELYTRAVEQLGNDKASVRLGGLYALERLAQDNPAHRQTIVNVICAYLRMPFSPTAPVIKPESEATEAPEVPAAETQRKTEGAGDTWRQERQVRLTAQRILGEHLRDDRLRDRRSTDPPNPRFWPGIRLNLADATLIDVNLQDGVVADSDFRGATFTGNVVFDTTTFTGSAQFDGATFTGNASFLNAAFTGSAQFDGATFGGHAAFSEATFRHNVLFDEATFRGNAAFSEATFSGAGFRKSTFGGRAVFHNATFSLPPWFVGATFSGQAWFGEATFNGALFDGATFGGGAVFDNATFRGRAAFSGATFGGGGDSLSFTGSRVPSPDAEHVWPTGWRLEPDGSGGCTVVRANDKDRSLPTRPCAPRKGG